jgi:hypothetical protein
MLSKINLIRFFKFDTIITGKYVGNGRFITPLFKKAVFIEEINVASNTIGVIYANERNIFLGIIGIPLSIILTLFSLIVLQAVIALDILYLRLKLNRWVKKT